MTDDFDSAKSLPVSPDANWVGFFGGGDVQTRNHFT